MGKPEGCQVLEIYFAPEEPKIALNKWEAKILLVEGKQFFQLIQDVMDQKEDVDELDKYLKYHQSLLTILKKWTKEEKKDEITGNINVANNNSR